MLGAGADQYVVKTGRLRPLLEALDQAFADGMMVGTSGSAPTSDVTTGGSVGSG